jgi:hypothetical protein
MLGDHWFTFPVWDGVELVIDSADTEVHDRALAEFVTQYDDYNLLYEWETDRGVVIKFVPAPEAVIPAQSEPNRPVRVPAAAESGRRAARPAGKGRRIPRQPDVA